MSRIAYVNGAYVPHRQAAVHVEDRGFQFADGVYEVIYLNEGRLIDCDLHLARLERSLREVRIAMPRTRAALLRIIGELAYRNRLRRALVYLQVTRGSAPRNHAFPAAGTAVTLVVTLRGTTRFPTTIDEWTGSAITLPDERWARCDIKSVSLLPNVLARQAARDRGALEAILVDRDGVVTEGASTSVWIVDDRGVLRTRPVSQALLPGCTRAALIAEMTMRQIRFEERAFTVAELRAAREIFVTAATTFVKPIVALDGMTVGAGGPGPVARQMFALLAHRFAGEQRQL